MKYRETIMDLLFYILALLLGSSATILIIAKKYKLPSLKIPFITVNSILIVIGIVILITVCIFINRDRNKLNSK